jgi:hypothetical protein
MKATLSIKIIGVGEKLSKAMSEPILILIEIPFVWAAHKAVQE